MNVIKGGFLGKSAGYYYYIQNIKLNKIGWVSAKLKYKNNVSSIYENNGTDLTFEMKQDNNYNILLQVNDVTIITDKHLFDYELELELELETNQNHNDVYTLSEGLIVDH